MAQVWRVDHRSDEDSSSSSAAAATPVPSHQHDPAATTAAMRQWYAEPHAAWRWYCYDPAWHWLSSPLSSPAPMSGPSPPSTSGIAPILASDAALEPVLASLKALQSHFTALQEGLGGIKSDVKDAISQLHALRTAQTKSDKSIAELEAVIGVSSTGTRPRARTKRGRGRGRGGTTGTTTEVPSEGDGVQVPERSLVQSVASIQSAIEVLIARSHQPCIHRPSVNHFAGQASTDTSGSSPHPSVTHPSRQHTTLRSMQFTFPVTLTPQSESFSHPSSITPTQESGRPRGAQEKKYADASIQTCTFLPAPDFASFINTHGDAPGFTPVDWNDLATHGRFDNLSGRPTTFTTGHLAHSLCDAHNRSAPNTVSASDTQLHTRATTSTALESNPKIQRADSTVLPTALTSSASSSMPFTSDTTHTVETQLSPAAVTIQSSERLQSQSLPPGGADSSGVRFETRPSGNSQMSITSSLGSLTSAPGMPTPPPLRSFSIQTPSLTTEGTNSSMIPLEMGPSGVSTSFTSPLSSLSSTPDTAMLVPGASGPETHVDIPGRRQVELGPEEAQMTADTERDAISVMGAATTSLPSASTYEPVEVDDGGLPSGLSTPSSEAYADAHVSRSISRSSRERGVATELISRADLSRAYPVIPTPPSLTPEPLSKEDPGTSSVTGGAGLLGAVSELPLPLTSPLFSPCSTVGGSLAEEGDGDVGTQIDVYKERMEYPNATERTVVYGVDASDGASAGDAGSNLQTDPVGNEPATTPTNELRWLGATRAAADTAQSKSPESSVCQPNTEVPEHNHGAAQAYFSPQAYGSGYDFHFSSPIRLASPLTSSTSSRYATPSESSDVRPTQDEDEVWHALVLSASGVSTPLSGSSSLPMIFSRTPSVRPPPASQPLSVDPSVLQMRGPPAASVPVPVPVPDKTGSPRVSDGSMSPLTSLADTDVEKDAGVEDGDPVAADGTPTPRARVSGNASTSKPKPRSDSYGGHRLELCHGASVRAASETTGVVGRLAGGPGASVEELAMLARRAPLKIRLRLSEVGRGVKRKRDVDMCGGIDCGGGEGMGEEVGAGERAAEGREEGDTDDELGLFGDGEEMHVDGDTQGDGDALPVRVEEEAPAPDTATSTSIVFQPAERSISGGIANTTGEYPDVTADSPVPRQATKREGERRHKKRKRTSKADSSSVIRYHVHNGQIVAVTSEPTSQSQAPATPPASSHGGIQEARAPTPVSDRKGRQNRAMKTLLSSPAHPGQPSSRRLKSSPTKEDVWSTTPRRAGTWPELPIMFSHWDIQFIQCDKCDKWYHYGCVAIGTGDPRLEPGVVFTCPGCYPSAKSPKHQNQDDACARPDCPEPRVTTESELYFVEKLVGRKKVEGYMYMWLAKWEGYPMSQATWIPKENVVGDGTRMISAFLENAVVEGADLSRDVVLLQEALDGGWEA